MNKEYTKRILSTNPEIPLAKSAFVQKGDNLKEKTKDLKYPVFTKPVSEGSSFGMTKVDTPEELEEAYNQAVKYNDDVLVEEFIKGAFVTVGVLEQDGKNFATEILEIRPKNEWYDFESKYTPGMSEFVLPAELSEDLTKKVKEIAVKSHETAGCRGVSRVDFMISQDNIPYVIEINTSPGMTATSDLPAQSKVMGITYDNLVQIILNGAGLNK
jgi:D-alanine-D-alanine ligase